MFGVGSRSSGLWAVSWAGSETVIEFDINGETFTAKGLMVEQLNYLEVYPYDRWTDKTLPVFQEGEQIMPSGASDAPHRVQSVRIPASSHRDDDLRSSSGNA